MDYEDRISVPTPEGVEIEMVLAGLGSRLAASLIDFVIINVILLSLWIGGLILATPADLAGGVLTASLIGATFLVLFGYDTAFETFNSGRSPGKRVLGIRVVRSGGEPPGFLAAAIRNLLRLVDVGILPVGVLCILFTARHQRVGDLAAGTLVIREIRPGLAPPAGWTGPVQWAGADRYAGWDVSGVTPDEVATVRRFLERRFSLDPGARLQLGEELAARIRPRVPGVPPAASAEEFLEGLSAAKAARA
ncbi:MAG: RDD family protein [Acidimicrobiia bacterium]